VCSFQQFFDGTEVVVSGVLNGSDFSSFTVKISGREKSRDVRVEKEVDFPVGGSGLVSYFGRGRTGGLTGRTGLGEGDGDDGDKGDDGKAETHPEEKKKHPNQLSKQPQPRPGSVGSVETISDPEWPESSIDPDSPDVDPDFTVHDGEEEGFNYPRDPDSPDTADREREETIQNEDRHYPSHGDHPPHYPPGTV
jgi:hypothetical protein